MDRINFREFVFLISMGLLIFWVDYPRISEIKILNIFLLIAICLIYFVLTRIEKAVYAQQFLSYIFPLLITILMFDNLKFAVVIYLMYFSTSLVNKTSNLEKINT